MNNSYAVVVMVEGQTLKATSDGTEYGTFFEGSESHIVRAKSIIRREMEVSLSNPRYGPWVVAGYDSPIALTAAMVNAGNYEGEIMEAPQEVADYIESCASKHNCESIDF